MDTTDRSSLMIIMLLCKSCQCHAGPQYYAEYQLDVDTHDTYADGQGGLVTAELNWSEARYYYPLFISGPGAVQR